MNKRDDPRRRSAHWGLDSRHNTKPTLILRADRQPGVSEGRAPSPSPHRRLEPPLGHRDFR
jgi:hypothetical protein